MAGMAPTPKRRLFRLTHDHFVIGLLVAECLLWLSERFRWFPFNSHAGWTVLIAVAAVGVAFLFILFWFIASLLFRCRFQFSIRSLLVLVVVVAVPSSWLGAEIRQAKREREAAAALEKLGGSVERWTPERWGTPSGPQWLRSVLGDNFFDAVWGASFPHT
jgi:hypothetical protein